MVKYGYEQKKDSSLLILGIICTGHGQETRLPYEPTRGYPPHHATSNLLGVLCHPMWPTFGAIRRHGMYFCKVGLVG
jgi:hypothetical protein